MNNSPVGIKTVIIFIVIISIIFQKLFSGLGIDSNTVISQIAFLLFISMVGYYLFPQARIRKHRISTPKHRQYSEGRTTDLMMEKIMRAYKIEEETDDTEDGSDEEVQEEINEKIVVDQENEADKEIIEEVGGNQENDTDEEVDEEVEEEIIEEADENQEDETDEEVDEETEHRHYDDSRLTDYVMKKIMKAYGVNEENEEESDEEVEEDQEDETDEGVNEETEHRRYANSSFTNYVMKRRIKAHGVIEEIKEESEDSDEAEEVEEVRKKFENKPQIAIYDGTEEESTGLIKALFSPVQLPLTLSGLWFITIVIIYNFLPEVEQLIPSSIPSLAITVVPILLLIGLSGFIGVLLEQFNENLEVTFKEKIISALNIFKILIGWGVGAFVFIKLFN